MLSFNEIYLTKQQILERISEREIYEYYLGEKVTTDKLVKCCFHKDSNASMGFHTKHNQELKYKCFSCGSNGSVFDFVASLHNCSYHKALKIIQDTFKLSRNGNVDSKYSINNSNNNYNIRDERSLKTLILPTYRPFNIIDYNYWTRYHIPLSLLAKYKIKACSHVYIVTKSGEYKLFAKHRDDNPIYSYKIVGNINSSHYDDQFKIYRPYSDKKGKWVSNTDQFGIQGLEQLPKKGELLIITSSMKDVLVLNLMGYNAIALGGEGNTIPEKILDYLWACFDNIVVFYDNDKAGLKYGKNFSEQIGAGNIYIPVEYETKDISDYVEKYTFIKGIELMKELL